jgi:Fur family iron response transcriptional regulator
MSIATVYNCLKRFKNVGLINQVESIKDTAIFDTNMDFHHHFLDEETGELTDIKNNEIRLLKLPETPEGYINSGVDIIIKIKKNN